MLFSPKSEKGQGLVEYALILVLVAIVVIAILWLLIVKVLWPLTVMYIIPAIKAAWEGA